MVIKHQVQGPATAELRKARGALFALLLVDWSATTDVHGERRGT